MKSRFQIQMFKKLLLTVILVNALVPIGKAQVKNRFDGLVHTAIYDKVRLKLDEEQLQALKDARKGIREMKHRYKTDSLPSTLDSINDFDHTVALNILTQKQFRRVVMLNYTNMVEDRDKIWARIDSAQLTSDLDEGQAKYSIQQYLVDVRTAEETYWNDKEMRNKARHQVKVYAPPVVKRYFSTKKKKEKTENKQFENYLW